MVFFNKDGRKVAKNFDKFCKENLNALLISKCFCPTCEEEPVVTKLDSESSDDECRDLHNKKNPAVKYSYKFRKSGEIKDFSIEVANDIVMAVNGILSSESSEEKRKIKETLTGKENPVSDIRQEVCKLFKKNTVNFPSPALPTLEKLLDGIKNGTLKKDDIRIFNYFMKQKGESYESILKTIKEGYILPTKLLSKEGFEQILPLNLKSKKEIEKNEIIK